MQTFLTIIGTLILAALGYLIYILQKPKTDDQTQRIMFELLENLRKEVSESGHQNRKETQDRLDKIMETMNTHQNISRESMHKQLSESAKLIQDVTKKLTQIDATNKQVVGFAEQMKSLENILKNPKHRGVLGEYFLESMLDSIMGPGLFQMQYKFANGEIVDAVIFLKDQLIPIDSKFSLEKYNQLMSETDKEKREKLEKEFRADVKKRIDETSKYVRPEEKTTEFAFMYIPAEGIFHSLLVNSVGVSVNSQNLIEYAFSKRVIIVSPSSFIAYLQTVLQGLNQLKMEQGFKEIQKNVIQLGNHISSFDEKMQKMGAHLGTTVSMYNQSYKEFRKIDKDVYKISDQSAGGKIEVLELDKPNVE